MGAVAKSLASFDDAVARIPVITQFTRTRQGRIAFSIGNILAVTVAIGLAWGLSSVLHLIPHAHILTAMLILGLAAAVQFDLFGKKQEQKIEKSRKKVQQHISSARFFRLMGIGFIASLVTLLDDSIVLTALFLGEQKQQIASVIGIYISTFIQVVLSIYAAEKLGKLKYIKETAVGGLVLLSILIFFQIL